MNKRQAASSFATILAGAVLLAGTVATSALAGDKPSKAEIEAAVSDKTYQGSMLKNAFVEYYGADGSIKGKDYDGKWRVTDGVMCFQYGGDPETCWDVEVNGPAMTMFKDGKVDGNGILFEGNPNKF